MSKIEFKAIGYNVLLKMPVQKEKTKSGIILNYNKTKNLLQNVGEIVSMGCDAFKNAFDDMDKKAPKIGEYVYINKHAGHDIHNDEELYRIVSSEEIRGVITKEQYEKFADLF